MITKILSKRLVFLALGAIVCSGFANRLFAGNDIMGELKFVGASKIEKTSGVWVDGQYVGYLKELKGSKKVLLMPGEHEVTVRQAGYKEFSLKIVLEPGQKQVVNVAMEKDESATFPDATAEVKMSVSPNRAAVFVDDRFVGHVDEFDGPGQALLLAPGKHRVKISLPGYQTFETEVSLLANQKFELKTDLFKGSILQAGPLIKNQGTTKE
jgi:PEGA domain